MQCGFRNSKCCTKVPDSSPLRKGNQLHRFSNVIMVPLSATTTVAFFGTCSKLSYVRIVEICDGTSPNPPNCFRTDMIFQGDCVEGSTGKFTVITLTLHQQPGNNLVALVTGQVFLPPSLLDRSWLGVSAFHCPRYNSFNWERLLRAKKRPFKQFSIHEMSIFISNRGHQFHLLDEEKNTVQCTGVRNIVELLYRSPIVLVLSLH